MNVDAIIAKIEAAKPIVRELVPEAADLVIEGGLDVAELILTFVPKERHGAAVAQLQAWLRSGAKQALQVELEQELKA